MSDRRKTIGFWGPSGELPRCNIKLLNRAKQFLESKGYSIYIPTNLCLSRGLKNLSITERLEDLSELIESTDIIQSVCGGYYSVELLDRINFDLINKKQTTLIGYSDTTSLLLPWYSCAKSRAIHGPMAYPDFMDSCGCLRETWSSLLRCLDDSEGSYEYKQCGSVVLEDVDWNDPKRYKKPRRAKLQRNALFTYNMSNQKVRGKILGGNLTLFERLLGTKFLPLDELNGACLCFEDWQLHFEDLTNLLHHLKVKGVFDRINLLVFGDVLFSGLSRDKSNEIVKKVIGRFSKVIDKPIIGGCTFGHRQPTLSFKLGDELELANADALLKLSYFHVNTMHNGRSD